MQIKRLCHFIQIHYDGIMGKALKNSTLSNAMI